MHGRILFGVAAWLLGAATATAGSLLAVSLLGQGITGASGPLLTGDAVNRALASESAKSGTGQAIASPGARTVLGSSSATPTATAPAGTTPTMAATATRPQAVASTSSAPASAAALATGDGTLLGSRGGDVVASCLATGAYLDSWSPALGYEAGTVYRGPGTAARVTFEPASTSGAAITMVVTCSAGVPSAVSHTREPGDE